MKELYLVVPLLASTLACWVDGYRVMDVTRVPPGTVWELWRELDNIDMQPVRGTDYSMLLSAGLGRKSQDRTQRACVRPARHALLDEHGGTVERMDLGAGLRPVLFLAPQPNKPIIILVHGLFDSKYVRYLDETAVLLATQGFGVIVPDMRWHGCRIDDSLPSLGPEEARDLAMVARWSRARYRDSPVGLIGYSLGAQIVGHALAHDEGPDLFRAGGIGFSPPGELAYTLDWFDRAWPDVYARIFRSWVRKRLRAAGIPWERGGEFRSAVNWLSSYWGYSTLADFLSEIDLAAKIPHISRPLLLYASADDPYFTTAAAEHLQRWSAGSDCVRVQITPAGGHIAHMLVDPAWYKASILTFFGASPEVECVHR